MLQMKFLIMEHARCIDNTGDDLGLFYLEFYLIK